MNRAGLHNGCEAHNRVQRWDCGGIHPEWAHRRGWVWLFHDSDYRNSVCGRWISEHSPARNTEVEWSGGAQNWDVCVTHIRVQNFCELLQFPVLPAGDAFVVRKSSVQPVFILFVLRHPTKNPLGRERELNLLCELLEMPPAGGTGNRSSSQKFCNLMWVTSVFGVWSSDGSVFAGCLRRCRVKAEWINNPRE